MIDKNEVINFFDNRAASWDAEMIKSGEKIARILDNAHVTAGTRLLDVACGTGVMLPDYLARGVADITAIDISPEMIRIAQEKFPQENLHFICGDVETADVGCDYDTIVVYNAFPHFPDGARLVHRLASLLKEGGMLTIAHGMSRATIDAHHHGSASSVSNGLMSVTELAGIFSDCLKVTTILSDEGMYQVVGRKVSNAQMEHPHPHPQPAEVETPQKADFPAQALLNYMVQHNAGHMDELLGLTAHVQGPAKEELSAAAELMHQQNEHLKKALQLLQGI